MKKILDHAQYALPIALLVAFARVNQKGIGDLDSWWHVRIGDQIRTGIPFNDLGNSWSLYSSDWQTSQWLSEFLMSLSHQAFGWKGLLWWRLVFGLTLLLGVVVSLARRNRLPAAMVTSIISYFVLVPLIQERPALIGLIFVVALGANCYPIWRTGHISKNTWLWVPATALWANFHGSWILAPTALLFSCLLALPQIRTRRFVGRSLLLTTLVTIAGCLTPIGWRGALLPFKLHQTAGKFITEWQMTNLKDPLAYGLLALLAILVMLWTVGTFRPSLRELIWVTGWTIFAFTAFRNVGPATLFITPVVAHRLDQWFAKLDDTHLLPFRTWPIRPLALSLAASLVTIFIWTSLINPLDDVTPRFIAERLSHSKQELRIINDYNASGVLLALGGEHVHLAVDGRADRYDQKWLTEYLSILANPTPNKYLLDQLKPNAAVLPNSSPLIWHYIQNRHWKKVMTEGRLVLLVHPTIKL